MSAPPSHPQRGLAESLLVVICVIWALGFLWTKDALGSADPMTFLALRFGVGAVLLTPLARGALFHPQALRGGVMMGALLFLGYVLQTSGLVYTTPARSGFITGMCVVLVPFASLLIFKRMPGLPAMGGVVLAALGLYLLTSGVGDVNAPPTSTLLGDALTLAGSAVYAVHITLTERWSRRAPPVALVGVQLWVVALLSLATLPFVEIRFESTQLLWTGVLLCGGLASAFAISVQTWAQARTTAVRAAVIYSLEPVFTAFLSSFMGHDVLGLREWSGGALVILGVLVAEVGAHLLARRRPLAADVPQA